MKAAQLLDGYLWWNQYGGLVPELQRLAMSILAQPASACACERAWSTNGFIQERKKEEGKKKERPNGFIHR